MSRRKPATRKKPHHPLAPPPGIEASDWALTPPLVQEACIRWTERAARLEARLPYLQALVELQESSAAMAFPQPLDLQGHQE